MERDLEEEKLSPARAKAKAEHERLLRDDPAYRKNWEEVTRIWTTLLADVPPIPDNT